MRYEEPIITTVSQQGLDKDDSLDQGRQLRDTSINFDSSNNDKPGSCRVESIIQDTNQYIRISKKARKAYHKQKESSSKQKDRSLRRNRRTVTEAKTAEDSKVEGINLVEFRRRKAADECLRCDWPFDRKGSHLVKDCERPIKLDKGTAPFAKSGRYPKPVIPSEKDSLEESTDSEDIETTENSGWPNNIGKDRTAVRT